MIRTQAGDYVNAMDLAKEALVMEKKLGERTEELAYIYTLLGFIKDQVIISLQTSK